MSEIKAKWLSTRPIAHRGLWDENTQENSLSAYQKAVDNGYPIEIDLYSSLDGVLYSFHDKDLERMTSEKGLIYEKSSSELNSLMLKGTSEHIPTFTSVLELVNGKIPLLIEIKNQPDKLIVERVLEALKDYAGEYAIQSFNPLYINKVRKLAPEITRGLLYTSDENEFKEQSKLEKFILKKMALNFLIKPHFLSCRKEEFPLSKRKAKGKIIIAWTVTCEEHFKKIKPLADNIIFEGFVPKV